MRALRGFRCLARTGTRFGRHDFDVHLADGDTRPLGWWCARRSRERSWWRNDDIREHGYHRSRWGRVAALGGRRLDGRRHPAVRRLHGFAEHGPRILVPGGHRWWFDRWRRRRVGWVGRGRARLARKRRGFRLRLVWDGACRCLMRDCLWRSWRRDARLGRRARGLRSRRGHRGRLDIAVHVAGCVGRGRWRMHGDRRRAKRNVGGRDRRRSFVQPHVEPLFERRFSHGDGTEIRIVQALVNVRQR